MSETGNRAMTGRDVQAGMPVVLGPLGKPVVFVSISDERHTQSALGVTYRIGVDARDVSYALFDDSPVAPAVLRGEADPREARQ